MNRRSRRTSRTPGASPAKFWFIRLFGGMTRNRVDSSRHHSDVPYLQGDTSVCCNTTARRSGGRLCGEATCPGISWPPMRPGRVNPWPRFLARGLWESRQWPHRSHASVNPDAVRHFEIPPKSRMNPFSVDSVRSVSPSRNFKTRDRGHSMPRSSPHSDRRHGTRRSAVHHP